MIQNYYIARIRIRECRADIRINDMPVVSKEVEGEMSMDMPVNPFIERSGDQSLYVGIYPKFESLSMNSSAACSVEIWRYDGSGSELVPLGQVCTSVLSMKDENILHSVKIDKKIFPAIVSYSINRWGNCKKLEKSRRMSTEIASFFKNVGDMLANRQYDRFRELIFERECNICTALCLDRSEVDVRYQMLVDCLDKGFMLVPMKGRKLLEFYADGRVVTVLDEDMQSALRFVNEETGDELVLDLMLGIKNGQDAFSVI